MVVKADRRANSIADSEFPPRTGGIQGPCRDVGVGSRLCDAQKASALHTLIRQRHPTPLCGGHAPTAERTMNPARMCLESLDHRPGIREQPRPKPATDLVSLSASSSSSLILSRVLRYRSLLTLLGANLFCVLSFLVPMPDHRFEFFFQRSWR